MGTDRDHNNFRMYFTNDRVIKGVIECFVDLISHKRGNILSRDGAVILRMDLTAVDYYMVPPIH